jgi:hypothetical protein
MLLTIYIYKLHSKFSSPYLNRSNFQFKTNDENLQYEQEYKYLGIIFQEKTLIFNIMMILFQNRWTCIGSIFPTETYTLGFQLKMFLKCVLDPRNYHSIEMVQDGALHYFLGVHRWIPLLALHGKFGWKLPYHSHCINCVSYRDRRLLMDDNRITKHVLLWVWISATHLTGLHKLYWYMSLYVSKIYIMGYFCVTSQF